MLKRCIIFMLCLLPSLTAGAGSMRSEFLWDIDDVLVERSSDNRLVVTVTFDILSDAVAANSAVVLQPRLLVGKSRRDLIPMAFYRLDKKGRRAGGRSGASASGGASEVAKICGFAKGRQVVTSVVDCPSRSDSLRIVVEVTEWRGGKSSVAELRDVAFLELVPEPEFDPGLPLMPLSPDKYPRERYVTVPLNVSFEDGKDVFDAGLGVNECGLYDFASLVTPVIGSPMTKVSDVKLKAYTDLEGPAASRKNSASVRLNGIYSVLRKRGVFKRKSVQLVPVGEDWEGVSEWLSGTYWGGDPAVSGILSDASMPKDVKERELKRNVALWNYMKENLFPGLNRYECTFKFGMAAYADDADRWVAYNQDKRMLMPYDFYCLLLSFDEHGPAWYDVVYDFLDQYPDCLEARIAALSGLFSQGRVNEAGELLRDIEPSAYSDYYRAVWLTRIGQVDEAYSVASGISGEGFRNTVARIGDIYRHRHSRTPWNVTLFPRFKKI